MGEKVLDLKKRGPGHEEKGPVKRCLSYTKEVAEVARVIAEETKAQADSDDTEINKLLKGQ